MIPKIIHFIWFGHGKYNKRIKACIDSWCKYLPDYEFKLWDEDSFDITKSCKFVQEAYVNKKFAFVSDYVRLYALYYEGGIYMDTDIEVLKPFDETILKNEVVFSLDDGGYLSALMMSTPKQQFFAEMLDFYHNMSFLKEDGSFNMEVNNTFLQKKLIALGYKRENVLQKTSEGFVFFPDDYFHCRSLTTGKLNKTSNTYTIHWHTITWVPVKTRIINFLRIHIIVPLVGHNQYTKITKKVKSDASSF